MVHRQGGRNSTFIPFKRTKPAIGAEHHTSFARKASGVPRCSVQSGGGPCSASTLVHVTDPTLVKIKIYSLLLII